MAAWINRILITPMDQALGSTRSRSTTIPRLAPQATLFDLYVNKSSGMVGRAPPRNHRNRLLDAMREMIADGEHCNEGDEGDSGRGVHLKRCLRILVRLRTHGKRLSQRNPPRTPISSGCTTPTRNSGRTIPSGGISFYNSPSCHDHLLFPRDDPHQVSRVMRRFALVLAVGVSRRPAIFGRQAMRR